MGKLGDCAAKARALWEHDKHKMTGAVAIYSKSLGHEKYDLIISPPAFTADVSHTEDKMLPEIEKRLADPSRGINRVAIYTYYNPCTACAPKLLPLPAKYPAVSWKLGFAAYYFGTPSVGRSGVWPSEMQAKKSVNALMGNGWTVKIYTSASTPKSIPDAATKLRDEVEFQDYWNSLGEKEQAEFFSVESVAMNLESDPPKSGSV